MQNMQNISPLFFLSKEQKSKISESESSINSRTCLDHLVLFSYAYVWAFSIVFLGALSWSANFASQKVRLTTFYLCAWWQGKYQKEYFAKVIHIWRLRRNWPFKYSLLILASKKVICYDVTNERLVCRKLDCKLQLFYQTQVRSFFFIVRSSPTHSVPVEDVNFSFMLTSMLMLMVMLTLKFAQSI